MEWQQLRKWTKLEISQIPENLRNTLNTWELRKFPKFLGIWEIPQIPGNLRKFSKYPDIWGIPQISSHLRNFQNLKNIHSQIPIGKWEISGNLQMPGNWGNFPNIWESGEFLKCLGIWEISQYLKISVGVLFNIFRNFLKILGGNMGYSPKTRESGKFSNS